MRAEGWGNSRGGSLPCAQGIRRWCLPLVEEWGTAIWDPAPLPVDGRAKPKCNIGRRAHSRRLIRVRWFSKGGSLQRVYLLRGGGGPLAPPSSPHRRRLQYYVRPPAYPDETAIQSATHTILRNPKVKSMFGKVLNIPDEPFDARDGDAILAGFSAMYAAQAYAKRAMQCDMYAQ